MSFELIETIEVGAGGASKLLFSNIPADGTDLLLKFSLRTNRTGISWDYQNFYFNSNGATCTVRRLYGTGTGYSQGTTSYLNPISCDSEDSASTFSNGEIYIPNYTGSQQKIASARMVTEAQNSTAYQALYAMLWPNTAVVNDVGIWGGGGTFVQYTTASLYKIY